jgi:hypothetical protein
MGGGILLVEREDWILVLAFYDSRVRLRMGGSFGIREEAWRMAFIWC